MSHFRIRRSFGDEGHYGGVDALQKFPSPKEFFNCLGYVLAHYVPGFLVEGRRVPIRAWCLVITDVEHGLLNLLIRDEPDHVPTVLGVQCVPMSHDVLVNWLGLHRGNQKV